MTVDGRGRVTIPKAIRDGLGLEPEDAVAFTIEGRAATMYRVDTRRP